MPLRVNDLLVSRITNAIILADISMSLVTSLLTIVIFYVFIRDQDCRGSFFTIYKAVNSMNTAKMKVGLGYDFLAMLLQVCAALTTRGFTFLDEFTETELYLQINFFLCYFTHVCQEFTNPFLCVNRATAVLLPIHHRRFWDNRFVLPCCFLVQFFSGLLLGSYSFRLDHFLMRYPTGERFPLAKDTPRLRRFFLVTNSLAFANCLFMIMLYGVVIWRFRKITNIDQASNGKLSENKRALSLLYTALAVLGLETIYCIFIGEAFVINVNYERDFRVFEATLYTFLDLYSCFPSYLLLYFCKPIREKVMKIISHIVCKRRKKVSTSSEKVMVKSLNRVDSCPVISQCPRLS